MAVFMINVCKFNGCGRTFPTLGDLIHHIEDTHIDYDPMVIEQKEASQPSCLPLSYVLRFFSETPKREVTTINPDVLKKLASVVKAPSIRSNTPTGSEFDEEDILSAQSEDSNDSWTTAEEFSSEFILRYGSRINASNNSNNSEKPFACPVPGCLKRYKNVNGIKYHSKNGHKKDGKVRKGFKCHCGKSYKTSQGLKSHSTSQHCSLQPSSPSSNVNQQAFKSLSLPLLQTIGCVGSSQSHIVNTLHNNHIRPISQLNEAPHFENTKTIRAVLENAGNKLLKDNQVTTLTLPKNIISNNIQTNIPNVVVNTSNISTIYQPKIENDIINNNIDLKPTQKTTNQYLTENFVSSTNSLGILTPASSPVSNMCDNIIRLPKDERTSLNQMKINTVQIPTMVNTHILPLSPVTPSNDMHDNFTVPTNIVSH